jgi:hypothetical protein
MAVEGPCHIGYSGPNTGFLSPVIDIDSALVIFLEFPGAIPPLAVQQIEGYRPLAFKYTSAGRVGIDIRIPVRIRVTIRVGVSVTIRVSVGVSVAIRIRIRVRIAIRV